eukprot:21234-Heterococcus_DN1.PRE.1
MILRALQKQPKDTDTAGETATPAVVPALGGEASVEDLHVEAEQNSAATIPIGAADELAVKPEVRLLAPHGSYRCN